MAMVANRFSVTGPIGVQTDKAASRQKINADETGVYRHSH
jgi:ClpP class serine protease